MTTQVTDKVKKVKVSLGYAKLSDAELLKRLQAILDSMTNNPAFPSPPVDMPTFKAGIDSLNTLVTNAIDGGKKTISAKRKQREAVIKMATQLGHYVEAASNNDLAVFNTSGFTAVSNTRIPPQPLQPVAIQWLDRGANTGQILVKLTSQTGAVSYELRYAVLPSGGAAPNWVSLMLAGSKTVTVSNLTPGLTYTFQARGLGRLGYSDWGDSMNFICA